MAGLLDRAVATQHGVRAEIDVGVEEFLDQRAERVGLGQSGDLVAELEVVEDVLDVGREAVEVVLEVRPAAAAGLPRERRSRSVKRDVL
ncbi:MAG: hypothetical protein MPW15_01670 [Candidatus Manganitrophus sp.]|nr:hypothetical protein [Candidatus Manganitrophus sp.]